MENITAVEDFKTIELTARQLEIIDLLWDSLKRDPQHRDRRMTHWGSKTKLGLARSIESIFRGFPEV